MHPILFRIPIPGWKLPILGVVTSLPFYSYGVLLGVSIVIGWFLSLSLAERDGLPREEMGNCYVVTALAALLGARLLYVVTNLDDFHGIEDVFAFRKGGMVAYGGFLGGFVGSWLYLRRHRVPLLPWADVAAPSLAAGLFVTRIGCYLLGCDFGKPLGEKAPAFLKRLGTFPHWPDGTVDVGTGAEAWIRHVDRHLISPDAPASLPVHPTQIYESLVGLLLFGLCVWQRKHQRFRGQVFMAFTFGYAVCRYAIELLRDDAERGEWGPMLAEHLLVPGAFLALSVGFAFGIARILERRELRVVAQIAAFLPALGLWLALRPANFAEATLVKLSTSQWIAVLTGFAAALAYGVFWDASKKNPAGAMALGLPETKAPEVEAEPAPEVAPAPKKRKKKAPKPAAAPSEPKTDDPGEDPSPAT